MICHCVVCKTPKIVEGDANKVTHGICSDFCRKVFERWKTKPYPRLALQDFYAHVKSWEKHGLDHLWLS
jgi:hypothetical protein